MRRPRLTVHRSLLLAVPCENISDNPKYIRVGYVILWRLPVTWEIHEGLTFAPMSPSRMLPATILRIRDVFADLSIELESSTYVRYPQ